MARDEKAHESELARILVQSSVDGMFAVDRDVRYTLWNAAMERFAGKTATEVLGRPVFDVFPFLRDLGLDQAVERALAGETVLLEAVPNTLPNGAVHYFDRHYLPLRDDGGAVIGIVGVVRDVTARREAEAALRASETKLRTAVEAAGVGLWSWDIQRDEVSWEAPLSVIFGLPVGTAPATREEYLRLVHPDDLNRETSRIADGTQRGSWDDEFRIVRPDGVVRWVISKSVIVQREGHDVAIGAVIDVTDRTQREEHDRRAQRLEAVGQLTAGIAHNFNNILMVLLPSLELAARDAPPDLAPLLVNAELAASRAAAIVRQLMTFAGRANPAARTVEAMAPLVERTVAFCAATFDRRIAVVGAYDRTALANVDPTQIDQAVANLVINARDALTNSTITEPKLSIDVSIVQGDAGDLSARSGEFVRLRVRDNGIGMDAETRGRIFEPFFTTKEVGEGTGLGLATTHAIVREHGGFITCESAPRRGTTFSVFLPRAATPAPLPATQPVAGDPGGTESILVVDDEPAIRRVVRQMLEPAGYAVRAVGSGEEAVDLLSDGRIASEIALVLLDVSMPGMAGLELRRRLRELAPHARIVIFTGYAPDAVRAETGEDVPDGVLEKPTTTARLLGTVREVLDRRR